MEDKCSVGEALESVCHQHTFTRNYGIKFLSSLSAGEREKILWRCHLKNHVFAVDNPTICFHHELVYGRVFERRSSDRCCDIYKKHKKKVKGGHTVSLEMAKKFELEGLHVLPGWKLCRGCLDNSMRNADDDNEDMPMCNEMEVPEVYEKEGEETDEELCKER